MSEEPPSYFDEIPPPRPPRRRKTQGALAPSRKPVPVVNGRDVEDADIIRPRGFTDDDVALRFSEMFAPSLRFVAGWNRWLYWDGTIWRRDDTLRIFDLARRLCRVVASEASEPRIGATLSAAKTVAAVEKLARSDRRHASTADEWDADPWLLNTPGGVVDLRTGELGPHDARNLITRMTAVTPGGECPGWMDFLGQVTGHNQHLISYLQRTAGYWLTGMTVEQAMWFLYGTGRNGKGVFLNTFARIMGDYAMTASPDTFTDEGRGKHLTVLARLHGARFVVSQETEEGVPWAEARIKSITGGDPITANFMRQDPFTFIPQFKLAISGNHKPELKSVDEAIKARFNLVPFVITIPAGQRDPGLSEKLWAEAPGILAWAIQGCLHWGSARLQPPSVVSDATKSYFDEEDAIQLWIADCCLAKTGVWEQSGKLFRSWTKWAIRAGEKPGSHKAFSRTMEKHGFPKGARTNQGYTIKGVCFPPPQRSRQENAHEWD